MINKTTILMSLLAISVTSLVFVSASAYKNSNENSTVAIIDLNRVAQETGYSRQISTQINGLKNNLQNELSQAQQVLTVSINEKKEEFGKKPSKDQQKELDELFVNAKLQLQQAQQQALGVIQQEQSSLVNQLYDVLRPYAKRIANEKGINVVILKSDTLIFDYNPDSDITDEVVAAVVEAKAIFTPKTQKSEPSNSSEDNTVSQTTHESNTNS